MNRRSCFVRARLQGERDRMEKSIWADRLQQVCGRLGKPRPPLNRHLQKGEIDRVPVGNGHQGLLGIKEGADDGVAGRSEQLLEVQCNDGLRFRQLGGPLTAAAGGLPLPE
jgi:hypothetical protein